MSLGTLPPGLGWLPGPPRLPGAWSFWADTLVGSVPLGPVAPAAFRCSWVLSDAGAGEVTLPAAQVPHGPDGDPGWLWGWRLWASWNGEPLWCGVPTGIQDSGRATATLTLAELAGYLVKRQWDVFPSARYNQVEQTEIARQIAQPLEDVGVVIEVRPGAGFARDRTYEYLEGSHRLELLQNLAGVISGPPFRTEYDMTAGHLPRCRLVIAYPSPGSAGTGLALTVPAGELEYGGAWDADKLRTRTFAVGDLPEDAAEGDPRPVAVAEVPQAGRPRLDERDEWPSVILLSTLQERAQTASVVQAFPALQLTAAAPDNAPPLGSYGVGDTVELSITTPLIPGGLTGPAILQAVEADAASGAVSWTVATSQPPPRARETLAGTLRRLDSNLNRPLTRGAAPV